MANHKESDLQTKICKWLRKTYPGIMFLTDFAAGTHLPMFYANLRSIQSCDDKMLDLIVLEPIQPYHGIIIELKVSDTDLFLKDGKTLKSEHVQLQYESILKLRTKGYYADFGIGEYDIKTIYTQYLCGTAQYKEVLPFRGTMQRDVNSKHADDFFNQFDHNHHCDDFELPF